MINLNPSERTRIYAEVDASYRLGTWLRLIAGFVLGAALALVTLVATASEWM